DQRGGQHARSRARVPDRSERSPRRRRDGSNVPRPARLLRSVDRRLRGALRSALHAGGAGDHDGHAARARGGAAVLLRGRAGAGSGRRRPAARAARGRARAAARGRRVPRLLHRLHAGPAVHDGRARAVDDPSPRYAAREGARGQRGHRRHPVLRLFGGEPRRVLAARADARAPLRSRRRRAHLAEAGRPRAVSPRRAPRVRRRRRPRRRRTLPAGDPMIRVLEPGPQTTVQDAGRAGHMRYGIPPSGPVDRPSFVLANRLVGNPDGAAALEFTLMGPRLRAEAPCSLAVTGADVAVTLNDAPAPAWTTLALATGDVVKIGAARTGVRGYVAFAGGVEVPPVLGSRATYLRGRLGGLRGRALARDDVLHLQPGPIPRRSVVPLPARPQWGGDIVLRVVLGPQADRFTDEGVAAFLGSAYEVLPQSDRMGARLNGPRIAPARARSTRKRWPSCPAATAAPPRSSTRIPSTSSAARARTSGTPTASSASTSTATTRASCSATLTATWSKRCRGSPRTVCPSPVPPSTRSASPRRSRGGCRRSRACASRTPGPRPP